MRVMDEWMNALGERVALTDAGRLVVFAANGQPLTGNSITPTRCDLPRTAPQARQSVHAANSAGVVELPYMAIPKPPVIVPAWLTERR